jgi:cytochrome c551/c552
MDFMSHGPGCDDLSTYRPFWRINLAEVSPESGDISFWDDREWIEAEVEIQLPLFERLSPSGEILSTFAEQGGYKWIPQFTDPLEQDEGWLFVLNHRESEGDGPIATGPADSFWPPAQWLDGETLSGNNPVLWFVPILKTNHGEPWWCMPDPEPDYSPCNAVLRAESLGQVLEPTPVPSPSLEHRASVTPAVEVKPTLSPTPSATSTLRPIAGEQAQGIILNSGCGSCHVIGSLGESGKVGPDLSNIGIDAGNRMPDQSADEFIRESILNPSAFIAPNCPNGPCLDNIMPADYKIRLSDNQIQTLVDFLLQQQRTTTDSETSDYTPDQEEIISEGPLEPAPTVKTDSKLIATSITIGTVLLILVLSFTIFGLLILLMFRRKNSSEDSPS